MKIALAQLNYHIGNFEGNAAKIKTAIADAKAQGANLVVFSELAICGYPPRDFLEFNDFINKCTEAIADIASVCTDIAAIVGGPSVNPKVEGKDLFNSAYFLHEGKIAAVSHKALLPNYDVFDEYRYFEPVKEFEVIEYMGKRIALTICEDLWDTEENLMYTLWPMEELAKQQPDLMINIAASPFDFKHVEARKRVLNINTTRYQLPAFYVNHVGAQTELIFDGGSMVVNAKGEVQHELKYFEEDLMVFDTDELEEDPVATDHSGSKISRIHDALVLGIRDYFAKLGFGKAILGLSGGIDSAVTLALTAEALGAENTYAVLMPSQFSSDHSVNDSDQMVANLGCQSDQIPIEPLFQSFSASLAPMFKDLPFGLAEENLQARARGVLLMALSNKFGHILLNTSNKSEAAVGYGTLYGDMCGGLSVLGDVYKTEVYDLARYINRSQEIIPENILVKAPSAELRPDQKDQDSLPEYDVLDQVLFHYIEEQLGPKEIVAKGFDEALVSSILRMVNINEYKRYQTAPVLRVSTKAFGMGRRVPIVGKYLA